MRLFKYSFLICMFFLSCERYDYTISTGKLQLDFCRNGELDDARFSVLSFNRLNGSSINSVSEVIESIAPDIIGLQESYDIGIHIAERFNYCFYGDKSNSLAILSKFPIESINDMQFKIMLNAEIYINFFNIHFTAYPYQPYDIRDTLITTALQAIHQAEQTRGSEVTELVNLISLIDNDMPIIVTGDFNEPSHLDWILGAENPMQFQFNNSMNQFIVDWPASNKMSSTGLIDTYRSYYPNALEYPGYTWTPFYSVDEIHDRIDFIYHSEHLVVDSVFVIGPDNTSDIQIDNYESDHRAVLAIFDISSYLND